MMQTCQRCGQPLPAPKSVAAQIPSRVPWSIDQFPARWESDETPPRRIVIEGNAAIDADVWVGWWEGQEHQGKCLWIIKGSGYVCNDEGKRIHARPELTGEDT